MVNCTGQNKNGTIIKLAAYMCEMGWFKRVNLIFLIKGHTKNSCDRMFNLLKIRWHRANVYTYQQSLEILNEIDQVTVIDASHLHFDYNTMLSKFYRQPVVGSISKNHVFQFEYNTKNCLMTTKRSNNVVISSTQPLRYDPRSRKSLHRNLCLLYTVPTKLDGPGLKPIKHVHLYTKWRKILPQQYKDITCPLPSNDIIMAVKKKKKKKNDENSDDDDGIDALFVGHTASTVENDTEGTGKDGDVHNPDQPNQHTEGGTEGAAPSVPQKKPKRKKLRKIQRKATANGIVLDVDSDVDSDMSDTEFVKLKRRINVTPRTCRLRSDGPSKSSENQDGNSDNQPTPRTPSNLNSDNQSKSPTKSPTQQTNNIDLEDHPSTLIRNLNLSSDDNDTESEPDNSPEKSSQQILHADVLPTPPRNLRSVQTIDDEDVHPATTPNTNTEKNQTSSINDNSRARGKQLSQLLPLKPKIPATKKDNEERKKASAKRKKDRKLEAMKKHKVAVDSLARRTRQMSKGPSQFTRRSNRRT